MRDLADVEKKLAVQPAREFPGSILEFQDAVWEPPGPARELPDPVQELSDTAWELPGLFFWWAQQEIDCKALLGKNDRISTDVEYGPVARSHCGY